MVCAPFLSSPASAPMVLPPSHCRRHLQLRGCRAPTSIMGGTQHHTCMICPALWPNWPQSGKSYHFTVIIVFIHMFPLHDLRWNAEDLSTCRIGLSRFYAGKSQSFRSLGSVKALEDLPEPGRLIIITRGRRCSCKPAWP